MQGALQAMGRTPAALEQAWLDAFSGRATAVVTNVADPAEHVPDDRDVLRAGGKGDLEVGDGQGARRQTRGPDGSARTNLAANGLRS